jgi:hypothetical protein
MMSLQRPTQRIPWFTRVALGAGAIVLIAGGGSFVIDRWIVKPSQAARDASHKNARVGPGQAPSGTAEFMLYPGNFQQTPGKEAPALELQGVREEDTFTLARYRGVTPVVLIFGSLSCDVLHPRLGDLEKLYQDYKGRVGFALIYLREAGHKIPQFEFLVKDLVEDVPDPSSRRSRQDVLKALKLAGLSMPAFMDSANLAAEQAYIAWPARLVVVTSDGLIARDFGTVFQRWDMQEVREVLDRESHHARTTQP